MDDSRAKRRQTFRDRQQSIVLVVLRLSTVARCAAAIVDTVFSRNTLQHSVNPVFVSSGSMNASKQIASGSL